MVHFQMLELLDKVEIQTGNYEISQEYLTSKVRINSGILNTFYLILNKLRWQSFIIVVEVVVKIWLPVRETSCTECLSADIVGGEVKKE
jgi:hypothetical protein